MGLFRKGKIGIIAKFHRTDLVFRSHSRGTKPPSYRRINTVCLSFRYSNSAHSDFVQGISWSGDHRLYTCGWDARVFCHTVSEPVQGHKIEWETTKMEINGFTPDQKDITNNLPQKCIPNESGDTDQTDCAS